MGQEIWYFANNSYHLCLAFCLQFLFTGGRSVSFMCHSALGSCVLSLCTILFLFINYQAHILIGYESGSSVGAMPLFERPSQCAQTAASASVRQSGSSVGAVPQFKGPSQCARTAAVESDLQ